MKRTSVEYVIRVAIANLCRTVLIFFIALLPWAVVPVAFGWTSTTVVSGSMEPAISVGDVVVIMPVNDDQLTNGRVILSTDPDKPDRMRLHRIVDKHEESIITRGDANPQNDSSPVTAASTTGVGVLAVPFVGIPIFLIHESSWLVLAGIAILLVALLAGADLDRRYVDDEETEPHDDEDGDDDERESEEVTTTQADAAT